MSSIVSSFREGAVQPPSTYKDPREETWEDQTAFFARDPLSANQQTAWDSPGQAAYDFRSDYVTSPNIAMLASIINTSLLDDVMKEDPTTNSFQEFIAQLTGHEDSLLVMSGTMGNQVALRTALLAPPYSILADSRSHIIGMEAGGPSTLCGALMQGVAPSNGHHLTLEDVKRHVTLREDVYDCPTRIISLENTLSGTIMPLEDVRAISNWARSQDPPIHMHLDGARLWEAVAAGAGTLKEYATCFDSAQLCFTKGLGAPIGSIVIGNKAFIKRARWMRKLLGGGIRAAGIVCAPARVAVEQIFLGGRLRANQETAKRLSKLWVSLGGKLQHPTETNMIWLDLEAAGIDKEHFADLAENAGVKTMRGRLQGRLIIHYQICDRALEALANLFAEILKGKRDYLQK
ncbi:l-allo-threonine aldolase [Aspergillus japonicus CBS 114.51]|uniref:L-allo-threonine aldolase n=2 Tax=Aspergillus TaxID=5052 RepID=A0A2V5H5P8_ASPV1|nr:l-allo-threonine aldolase [Aspergillus japonicus CBS 114.51]PYI16914.1 l-allo-threonine aldolase [Aspergillus violaceofuscus CBS 115571]RAH76586.1 l-allo-threonine aldolase [Aspergillus japonicus CBS 114.51]